MDIRPDTVRAQFALAFNMGHLHKANHLLKDWVTQEERKVRSRDLPTEAHVETVKTMHELVSYFLKTGDDAPLSSVKSIVVRTFINLEACLIASKEIDKDMDTLATYANLEIEHEQN